MGKLLNFADEHSRFDRKYLLLRLTVLHDKLILRITAQNAVQNGACTSVIKVQSANKVVGSFVVMFAFVQPVSSVTR